MYTRYGFISKSEYSRSGSDLRTAQPNPSVTLDSDGVNALNTALQRLEQLNPNHKYCTFAFISDVHRGHNGRYAQVLCDQEPTMKMIAKMNETYPLDAIVCGGDLINGYDEIQYYDENNQYIADLFNSYFPNLPVVSTVGNHDKRYNTNVPFRTNVNISELYKKFTASNGDVIVRELKGYPTNYAIDFVKHKIRLIVVNVYDAMDKINRDESASTINHGAWTRFMNVPDHDWMIGFVDHVPWFNTDGTSQAQYFINGKSSLIYNNKNGFNGKGYIGTFAGHTHAYDASEPDLFVIANSHTAVASDKGENQYCYAVYVIDTDNMNVHEVRVGRLAGTNTHNIQVQ